MLGKLLLKNKPYFGLRLQFCLHTDRVPYHRFRTYVCKPWPHQTNINILIKRLGQQRATAVLLDSFITVFILVNWLKVS